MKTFCILILSFIIVHFSFTQCTEVVFLNTQSQVDSFLINYPSCATEMNGDLFIEGQDITNIEGLLGIKRFKNLTLEYPSPIKSLHGLDSVKYFDKLRFNENQELVDASALTNVDSIGLFSFTFSDSLSDLSFLKKIKFINSLIIDRTGSIKGIEHTLKSTRYYAQNIPRYPTITISRNNYGNDYGKLFSPFIDSLRGVSIFDSKNFTLDGLGSRKIILNFHLSHCENFKLKGCKHIEKISTMKLRDCNFSDNENYSFDSLTEINHLTMESNINLNSMDKIFSQPFHIRYSIAIKSNEDLHSLSPLTDINIPDIFIQSIDPNADDTKYHLNISDNIMLDDCNHFLTCKALQTYPDSVKIENNGAMCSREYLLENCDDILSDKEVDLSDIVIYPNPFINYFNVSSEILRDEIELYNATGKKLSLQNADHNLYHTTHLRPGLYFLRFKESDKLYTKRLIKIE